MEMMMKLLHLLEEEPKVFWMFMCTDGLNGRDFKEFAELFIEKDMLVLLPILVARSQDILVESLVYKLCLEKLQESWKNRAANEVITEIKSLLDEIEKEKIEVEE